MNLQANPPSWLRRKINNWILRLSLLYFFVIAALACILYFAADNHLLPTMLLFGPRWVVAIPLLGLIPLGVIARSWKAGLALTLAELVVLFPISGFRLNPTADTDRAPNPDRVRIMTLNAGAKSLDPQRFRATVAENRPDIVFLQEAPGDLSPDAFPEGWIAKPPSFGLMLISRFPAEEVARAEGYSPSGLNHAWAKYRLRTPREEIVVVNLHLPTPRTGFDAVLAKEDRGREKLKRVIEERRATAKDATEFAGTLPQGLIVAGDFNMPVESNIYRECWSGYGNAFSDAGNGWGMTKRARYLGIRIDHILYLKQWICRTAWVGPDLGSDHRPVFADFERSSD